MTIKCEELFCNEDAKNSCSECMKVLCNKHTYTNGKHHYCEECAKNKVNN